MSLKFPESYVPSPYATSRSPGLRHWTDIALLVAMVLGAGGLWLSGTKSLLSTATSPTVVAGILLVAFAVTSVVLVLVPNDRKLTEAYGRWVGALTRVVQAGFFAAVLLFMPLPGALMRFFAAFLMSGGYWTLTSVAAHYGIGVAPAHAGRAAGGGT